ncbi:MAG: DNA-deoxyinosine glycosylase [Oribacterium sp.]|nr:DNA-deoxyinosine glycosylase [Oribacterium sp.]
MKIDHPIPPVFDQNSRILILGSFPSVKSRETAFFYGHPQNRFWRVVSAIYQENTPVTIPERRDFLLRHYIAVWDVVKSCEITGSSDASIRCAEVNDIRFILERAPIEEIFVNGKTAAKLYQKFTEPICGRQAYQLPSTSPANAVWSLNKLIAQWSVIVR